MSPRLTIDLAALEANYRRFERAGSIGAVVKADAYGLGVEPVTTRLAQSGCADFFVATASEGVVVAELLHRLARVARVWVFEGITPANPELFQGTGLRPVLNSAAQLARWQEFGGGPFGLHVDTGMQRLGVPFDDVGELELHGATPDLLLTHYACADTPEHPLNAVQTTRFQSVRKVFPSVPVSIGGSAALLGAAAAALPPVHVSRPGIGLYGGNPFMLGVNPMRPVVTLEARVLQLREVPPGTSVGYGATHVTGKVTRIATAGIGYADGVPRSLSGRGYFAVQGERVPLLGRVSMDLVQLDATGIGIEEGDWVEVFGRTITLDEQAQVAGTVSYEILTGLGPRIERSYLV